MKAYVMADLFNRAYEDIIGRVGGPMKFRLVIQPLMAALLAVRDGLRDAREGRPPYFWAVFTRAGRRIELLRDGWRSAGRVFGLAFIIDAVYQLIVLKWFYPVEAIFVSAALAFVPYLLIRGPVNRIARLMRRT